MPALMSSVVHHPPREIYANIHIIQRARSA